MTSFQNPNKTVRKKNIKIKEKVLFIEPMCVNSELIHDKFFCNKYNTYPSLIECENCHRAGNDIKLR